MNKTAKSSAEILNILFNKKAISFSFDIPFVYVNGLMSPFYIDNRIFISYPKERKIIVDKLVELIERMNWFKEIEYISSSLSFASPFGVMVAQKLNLPLVLVRDNKKTHGKYNKIEGEISSGKNVLIVEEHVSTGASLINNAQSLREIGCIVRYAIAITDTNIEIAEKEIKKNKINLSVLTDGEKIFEEALKRKIISKSQNLEIKEWLKNPVKWGDKRGFYSNTNN